MLCCQSNPHTVVKYMNVLNWKNLSIYYLTGIDIFDEHFCHALFSNKTCKLLYIKRNTLPLCWDDNLHANLHVHTTKSTLTIYIFVNKLPCIVL